MAETIFIETTIPSYYVARPSRSVLQLARQKLTRIWWDNHRADYDLYTSQIVLEEAADGDAEMAQRRLDVLAGIRLLDINKKVSELAEELLRRTILPSFAARDALHIAASSVHGIRFLLTWNCKHIANPHLRERIRTCFSRHGIELALICTPEEFIDDEDDQQDS